jgi:hypothetical protein
VRKSKVLRFTDMDINALPESRRSSQTAVGRDLPDADGPGFLGLNGSLRAENRSPIGPRAVASAAQMVT